MKKSLLAIALTLAAFSATAQPVNTAILTWEAPTYSDPLTYSIYQGLQGQPKVKVGTTSTLGATISTGLASGTTVCWHVTAVGNGLESAPSNTACKTFPFQAPAAPTNLTVK